MRSTPLHLSVLALAATLVAAGPARAQCTWGCHCEGSGCGCNSNGSGSSCDTGGTGCAVKKCGTEINLKLAPDGAPVRLASTGATGATANAAAAGQPLRLRWEYVSPGRSAARHCTGVVIARYFDPTAAALVRRRQHTVSPSAEGSRAPRAAPTPTPFR
jgi:hypothetical protein